MKLSDNAINGLSAVSVVSVERQGAEATRQGQVDLGLKVAGEQSATINLSLSELSDASEQISDSALIETIQQRVREGTFQINFDKVASSILSDAIALAGSRGALNRK